MRQRVLLVSSALVSLVSLAACGGGDLDAPPASLDDATVDTMKQADADIGADAEAAADTGPDAEAAADADTAPETAADADAADADANDAVDAYDAPPPITCESGVPVTVRLVAANLSSGNAQSYDPGPGGRILKALHPDVVMIQEFNFGTNSQADVQSFVTRYLGAEFTFTRGTGQIPNGVISRYPILAAGEWTDASVSNRAFVWARIDVPGPTDLVAVSVHLLTSSSGNRNAEATQLTTYLKANVTDGSYVAIAGDFNTDTRTEPALTSFSPVVVTTAPWPADQKANGNTNASRAKPYDWVVASPALVAQQVPLVLGGATYASGLVFDTRVFDATSIALLNTAGDPDAVLLTDSAAPNMQHMAVAKDFAVACP